MSHPSPAKTTRAANVFTVSQLNQRAKQLLEVSFATVKVEGELSSLSRPSSGHWYFSLKDSGAQVRCAMFRSRVAQLRFQPKEGDLIEIRARVSLYEARGDYQLIVDGMKPAGEGALLLAFQDLKKRLAQQGLFEPERKRPLPLPKRIGVITSPSGAALHDILTVLERRAPDIEVDIYPTQVQGAQAAGQIIEAIQRANRDNRVDVLIVGRGGGSMEDLWCFNDERLAHTIAQSSLPIISAVGHETDTTIADFVADQRAATPSAAAELVSPDHQQRVQQLQTLDHRLRQQMQARLQEARQQVSNVRHRLQSPEHTIQRHAQRLDQLESRLRRAWQQQQQQRQARLNQQQQALLGQHPERIIQLGQTRQQQLQQRLHRAMEQCLQQQRLQLANQVKLLDSLSPLSVLSRGYAICTALDGTVIQHPQQVRHGDRIQARLAQGTITCQVTDPDALHSDHSGNRSQ
jgi:exodeoxyribonuclease VII large subunit